MAFKMLTDTDSNGWYFDQNPTEWDQQDMTLWLRHLDEDLKVYADTFESHWITGEHFTRSQLGDAKWCETNLSMKPADAQSFAAAVRSRLIKFERSQRGLSDHDDEKFGFTECTLKCC